MNKNIFCILVLDKADKLRQTFRCLQHFCTFIAQYCAYFVDEQAGISATIKLNSPFKTKITVIKYQGQRYLCPRASCVG